MRKQGVYTAFLLKDKLARDDRQQSVVTERSHNSKLRRPYIREIDESDKRRLCVAQLFRHADLQRQ